MAGVFYSVMLIPFWAMFLGSPLKLAVWVGNRLLTWTGLVVVWRKLRHLPDRSRRFIVWMLALNAASLVLLVAVWRILAIH